MPGVVLFIGAAFLALSMYSSYLPSKQPREGITQPVSSGDSTALLDRHVVPVPLQTYPLKSFQLAPTVGSRLLSDVVSASVSKNMGDPAVAVHALRLRGYGLDVLPPNEKEFFNDELKLLTDDRHFREFGSGLSMLVETPFGAGYRTRSRASTRFSGSVSAIAEGGMTHVDKVPSVLGELGIGLDYPIVPVSNQTMTVADVLEDSLQRFSFERELEFSLIAYCCYLHQASWTTRHGTTHSVDEIAERLLERPAEDGVCLGTHRIYAIAKYSIWARRFSDISSPEIRSRCEAYLTRVSKLLADCQAKDGAWDGNWYVGFSQTAMPLIKDQVGQYADKFRATSHMLEWFAIVPPELRPPDETISRAIDFIIGQIEVNRNEIFNSQLLPATHAVRALLNLSEVKKEQ